MKPWLHLGLLFPLLLGAAGAATARRDVSELAHLFDYDSRQPLEIHDKTLKEFDCGAIHDISYVSPSGGLVSAYQIVPKGKGPFAAILFGHWGNGTRAEFIPDAEAYACAGAISLLPDYRWERPRPAYSEVDDLAHPDLDLRVRINTVIEMRRAIDLLLSRTDVDPNRVAYVGHSFGAQWGAILSSAAQPKTVLFYDSAHDLNDPKAFKDRSAWLSGRLPLHAAASR